MVKESLAFKPWRPAKVLQVRELELRGRFLLVESVSVLLSLPCRFSPSGYVHCVGNGLPCVGGSKGDCNRLVVKAMEDMKA